MCFSEEDIGVVIYAEGNYEKVARIIKYFGPLSLAFALPGCCLFSLMVLGTETTTGECIFLLCYLRCFWGLFYGIWRTSYAR